MDINNLKAFIEVADQKSFSRSAETLKLTQPAVSKRIAALESELSAKLFDRVGRTVHLTEAGRVLLLSARQISTELSRIEDVICNLGKDVSGTLSIGTTEHIGTHRLPEVLKPYRAAYPTVELDLHFASSQKTLQALEDGLIEVALCSIPSNQKLSPKLRTAQIWSDKMVIAVSKDHPLATGEAVPIDVLSKYPALLPSLRTNTRQTIDRILQANVAKVVVGIEANDFSTLKTMASFGLGWACIPEYQLDNTVTALDITELQLNFSISLVRHDDRTLSRAAQAFQDTMPTNTA